MTKTLQQKIDDFWCTSNSIEDYRDNIDKALQEFREQLLELDNVDPFWKHKVLTLIGENKQ